MTRTLGSVLGLAALIGLMVTLGCRPSPDAPSIATTPAIADDAGPSVAVPADDVKALVEANNAFAIDLYKKIAEKETGNIVLSPYSIHAALAMTYAGARGETAAEMAKVLGIEKLGDRVHPAHAELARKLKSDGGKDKPEFHVANALWGQKGFPFRPEYLNLTKEHYGAGLRELDFAADAEAARATINKWVSEQTRGMIRNLIQSGEISESTGMTLTNAVYFKGLWALPFAKQTTAQDKFWVAPDKTAPVQMMRRHLSTYYFEGDGVKITKLSYAGRMHSMVLIVPDARDGLAAVEGKLTADRLRGWLAGREAYDVDIHLPVFRASHRCELSGALDTMGMQRPFGLNADFSGMTSPTRLVLQKVIHEAVVEVDEEGTRAAAATAIVGAEPVSSPVVYKTATVRADRPFLLLIIEDASQSILFGGRFTGS